MAERTKPYKYSEEERDQRKANREARREGKPDAAAYSGPVDRKINEGLQATTVYPQVVNPFVERNSSVSDYINNELFPGVSNSSQGKSPISSFPFYREK